MSDYRKICEVLDDSRTASKILEWMAYPGSSHTGANGLVAQVQVVTGTGAWEVELQVRVSPEMSWEQIATFGDSDSAVASINYALGAQYRFLRTSGTGMSFRVGLTA